MRRSLVFGFIVAAALSLTGCEAGQPPASRMLKDQPAGIERATLNHATAQVGRGTASKPSDLAADEPIVAPDGERTGGRECCGSGDVNGDGNLTAGDAQMAFSITLSLIQPTPTQICAADWNNDSFITAGDAQAIFFNVLELPTPSHNLPCSCTCTADDQCAGNVCHNGTCCILGDTCNTPADCPESYTLLVCDQPGTCQGHLSPAACIDGLCASGTQVADDTACDAQVVYNHCGPYMDLTCSGQADQNPAALPPCATACSEEGNECDPEAVCSNDHCFALPGQTCTAHTHCLYNLCGNGQCCPMNPTEVVNVRSEEVDSLEIEIDSVVVNGPPVVEFTVRDEDGRGAAGLMAGSSGGNLRFGLAKLMPTEDGNPPEWQSYVNRTDSSGGVTVMQGNTDRTGTLIDHCDGSYSYTFAYDVTQATNPATGAPIVWEPGLTHRMAIQLSGSANNFSLPAVNQVYDFVPAGGAVSETYEVTDTATCNECHGRLSVHGSRYETKYCVICHNAGSIDPSTGLAVDMALMVHGIHSAPMRAADLAPEYTIGSADFAEVTYPQPLNNCRKCHQAGAGTPQGDAWNMYPTQQACGACHATVNFATHMGGQPDNGNCAMCHDSAFIADVHMGPDATPNNPNVPAGAYNIAYEISSVTVNANRQAVVTFRIMLDGASLNFASMPADLTGGPSFLVAYAAPQGDVAVPDDFNNLGKASAQPVSVTLANIRNGSQGSISGPDVNGYYTATITGSANAAQYPANAVMRAVSLQGYFSQSNFPAPGQTLARHAVSVVKTVTGDPERRQVVDSAKCANCHDWFLGHGGNRVYNMDVCVLCHNPNLTSSGRTSSVANISADTAAALQAAGYDPANPLTFPEESMNLKDLIHSAHAAEARTSNFDFVRNRGSSGVFYYDFSEITFPGNVRNCETCHLPNTYDVDLPAGLLPSTALISDGSDLTPAAVNLARNSVPNATDRVTTPVAAACGSCHDSSTVATHIEENGGAVRWQRGTLSPTQFETCIYCHGPGGYVDVSEVHDIE